MKKFVAILIAMARGQPPNGFGRSVACSVTADHVSGLPRRLINAAYYTIMSEDKCAASKPVSACLTRQNDALQQRGLPHLRRSICASLRLLLAAGAASF